MSQTLTTRDIAPLYFKCPRDIVHGLKKVALETDSNVHDVAMEAFSDYLNKYMHLVEKKVNITSMK